MEPGRFDLIIAADVLYGQSHATSMAGVIRRHAKPKTEVVITDPGHGNSADFTRLSGLQGFAFNLIKYRMKNTDVKPLRAQFLHYSRDVTTVTK